MKDSKKKKTNEDKKYKKPLRTPCKQSRYQQIAYCKIQFDYWFNFQAFRTMGMQMD